MLDFVKSLFDGEVLEKLLFSLILLVIGILAIRIVMVILKRGLKKTKLEKAAHTLITSLASVVLYILLGLSVASAVGIDVTGIVALASVLTLSLSLALQNMLANVIGGFTLLYTQPFHSGDYVEIAMQGGTVQEINMSYTKLLTPDNKAISIPNSAVVAAQIVNYSAESTRRVDVPVTVSQEIPTQKVIDALALAGTLDNVLLEPAPGAVVTGYGEGVINYSLRVWVKTEDYWDVFFAVNQRVKQIFDEQGIAMAYTHLNVHLHQ
ncbi:MAG: mechanosensitive ion channel family protein [Oscillospiraceae bacterium]|nr:mechanosensitive ion channel family protein [Oscillospiraceae bacterium]